MVQAVSHARHKPSKQLRDITHAASDIDYERLAQAVVEHIIFRKKDIYLRFPYFATFADDWPKGILHKKDGIHDIYKCKTYKVADWLHEKGFLPENAKNLMKAMRDWGYREARLTRLLSGEIVVDKNVGSAYNDGSDLEGGEE